MGNEQVKYPRTPHLPWSLGSTSDDKYASNEAIGNLSSGIELIVTEKMDGGNVTFTQNHMFARSITSRTHSWDTLAKSLWAKVRFDIPEGWRVSGESMHAQRSIKYDGLDDIYLVFGIWNEHNELLSWDETCLWAELIGLKMVPFLYRGHDYKKATLAWSEMLDSEHSEGYVLRSASSIPFANFPINVAKWVREGHVQTTASWRGRDDWEKNSFKLSA